jgi:uncharacterized protein YjcR
MSIKQRADGRWLFRVDRTGLPRVSKTFKTEEQAKAFEADYLRAYADRTRPEVNIIEHALAKRLVKLANKPKKSALEIKELAMLCKQFGTLQLDLAQAAQLHAEATRTTVAVSYALHAEKDNQAPSDGSEPRKERKGKAKGPKNDISGITPEDLDRVREALFFEYQQEWYARKNDPATCRTRFILKSRQIGATYYFAFEAFDDAIRTGDNQIFLSASRDQAEVFKAYIIAFAHEHFGLELKGTGVITLSNGAELRFLSTNSRTAQSYHGHLYVDECFWIPDFDKMWKVASGMASHKRWRRTLFSTPSAISHQAYPMWNGDKINKGRSEADKIHIDVTHKTLQYGGLGQDRIWRHMVTVKDAERMGCKLFDIEELQAEYSTDDFANLFMCRFIDDAQSVFNLGIMMTCYAPADYTDYNPKAARPFGNRPVALGYDPSRTRDNASLAILAIPLQSGGKWRVLQTLDYHGQNFQYQASRIKEIFDTHNVQHIGIDTTGIGYGLYELVEQFYSRVTPINYSNDTKTALVMKAIDVIENGRFEYQGGQTDITQAFMMITKTTTSGGGNITYASNRNNTSGHADKAWSIMHALSYEPLTKRKPTTVTFSN